MVSGPADLVRMRYEWAMKLTGYTYQSIYKQFILVKLEFRRKIVTVKDYCDFYDHDLPAMIAFINKEFHQEVGLPLPLTNVK